MNYANVLWGKCGFKRIISLFRVNVLFSWVVDYKLIGEYYGKMHIHYYFIIFSIANKGS